MSHTPHDHPSDAFPKAPTQAEWDRMSAAERQHVIDTLPNEVTDAEMSPSEGDLHFDGKLQPRDALREFFKRSGRRAYFACELPVYYPGARRFAPDLLGVLDVGDQSREKWLVSAEGKGLDFVLEVHVGGDRKKDAERNVAFYASLGIPEYFMYDRARSRLNGYRLADDARVYRPILPQVGRYRSEVLGLELMLVDGRLRFIYAEAMLPETAERVERLEHLVSELERCRDEEAERARAEAERARAEAERARAEAERADAAEKRLAVLQAELEKLKAGR